MTTMNTMLLTIHKWLKQYIIQYKQYQTMLITMQQYKFSIVVIRLAATRTKDAVVALELAAGECGSEPNPIWHRASERHHVRSPTMEGIRLYSSSIQLTDSDTRVTIRTRPTTECLGLPQSRTRRNRLRRCTVLPAGDSSAQIRFQRK
jgi:hypothetical protein